MQLLQTLTPNRGLPRRSHRPVSPGRESGDWKPRETKTDQQRYLPHALPVDHQAKNEQPVTQCLDRLAQLDLCFAVIPALDRGVCLARI